MIAFNTIEQMGAKTFNLINPDACEHRGAGAIEIARNRSGIERPHSKVRVILLNDQRSPGARDREGGGQTMRLAQPTRRAFEQLR